MGKTSVVHDQFSLVDGVYVCHHSDSCKPLAGSNSTSTLRAHLNSYHKKWQDNPAPPPPQLARNSPSKKRCLRQTSLDDRSFRVLNNSALLPAIASLFARMSWPHHAVEFDEFRHLIHCARYSTVDIPARQSVKDAQMQLAQQQQRSSSSRSGDEGDGAARISIC